MRIVHLSDSAETCKCGCGSKKVGLTGWQQGHNRIGRKNSPATRSKISLNRKGKGRRLGKNNPMYGKKPHNWNPDRIQQKNKVLARKSYFGLLRRVYRRMGSSKENKTIDELGYSSEEFRVHIESLFEEDMNWDNHGINGWHIDHIRPINTFNTDVLPSEVNALSNLRPLWSHINLRRPLDGSDENSSY